ncbi:MAG: DUF692 domain-containing protein [Aestuariivita sp.]|nr:DUF692 domain-containing protein [Aestuariivita sp.]MCY4346197.1 DUF692 domain-containing protein [Aestuariivita sp.]
MFDLARHHPNLPPLPGVGYKPVHFDEIMARSSPLAWLEIHAENYMGDGGRSHAQMRALSEYYPISVHGVGLSIGGEEPLDIEHIQRLQKLTHWLQPVSFSEHLAWSTHGTEFLNDLLPVPYTMQTLDRITAHIDQVQEALKRSILLENPSSYLVFSQSTWAETDFLKEISNRTGCYLLLDINNVFVSASNLGFSPTTYIDDFPLDRVRELHVGGHEEDQDGYGETLLIDSHKCAVSNPVWSLLDYTLAKTGPQPVLIEWDNEVPEWVVLDAEVHRVANALELISQPA